MNIIHAITNAARAVSGQPSPHHSIAPHPTRPATVSTVSGMPGTLGRSDPVRVTSNDVQELANYSQQHRLFPQARFEPDAFTRKYCAEPFLPDAGPGKSYFVNCVWNLVPFPRLTPSLLKTIIDLAEREGGPLFNEDMIQAERESLQEWQRMLDIGERHSTRSAFTLLQSASGGLKERLMAGEDIDTPIQHDQDGFYRHLAEVRSGCRAIQHDLSVAHVARIIPVCERLRDAARSIVEDIAAKTMQAAADSELEFVSPPRLLSLIFWAHTGRIGYGWQQPWWNALVLGIDLPSQPDLFGCGYKFWEPIPNPLRDRAALAAAEAEVSFRAELAAHREVDRRLARRTERLTPEEIREARNTPEMKRADAIVDACREENKKLAASQPPVGVQQVVIFNPTPPTP